MGNPISDFRKFYRKHLIETGQDKDRSFKNNINLIELSPMEQLDYVLKCLAYTKPPIHTSVEIVETLLFKGINTNEFEVIIILDKLIFDKNAIKQKRQLTEISSVVIKKYVWYYSITFAGRTLLSYEDGYSGIFKKENASKIKDEKNRKQLFVLTVLAAIGTFGTLIWDLTKYLIDKKICPNYYVEVFFHLMILPAFFALMYFVIRKLP